MYEQLLLWFKNHEGEEMSLGEIADKVDFRISDLALLNSVSELFKSDVILREIVEVDGRNTSKFVYREGAN